MNKISKIIVGLSLLGMVTCDVYGMQPEAAAQVDYLSRCSDDVLQNILIQLASSEDGSDYAIFLNLIKQLIQLRGVSKRFCFFLTNEEIARILKELSENINKYKVRHKGCTPLLAAFWDGYVGIVAVLLKTGAEKDGPDYNGISPLIAASLMGHANVVDILLQARVNQNKIDNFWRSALLLASLVGHVGVVDLLLKADAEKDRYDYLVRTPLLAAVEMENTDIVCLLLKAGADKDKCDCLGRTPLLIASEHGYADVVDLLLKAGADKDMPDYSGHTPLLVASEHRHKAVIALLLQAGARVPESLMPTLISLGFQTTEGWCSIL